MSATAESPTQPASVGAAARASSTALGFAAIVLAMLPAVLDQTILATALPTIAADLGSVTDVSWVVTAYVIAAAATTPLWGKLGDRHGRRRLLEASLGLFLAASATRRWRSSEPPLPAADARYLSLPMNKVALNVEPL